MSLTDEFNVNPLNVMQAIKGMLTEAEEIVFMNLLFSSSATIRVGNFGLSRREVEKQLKISNDDEQFNSFLMRVNQAVSRYFKVIYDVKRDQVIVMMRVPARSARSTLSKESLAILLFIFYQQEVLQHEFTLFDQLLNALGHETTKANQRLILNIDQLKKSGHSKNMIPIQMRRRIPSLELGLICSRIPFCGVRLNSVNPIN